MEKKEKTTPRVSIGMPVYNGEQFIHEAIDSLLAQTFTDFELIISDNASTDNTEDICREYAVKDARIRYIRQPANFGGLANFQYVFDEAVGEYFMWAADDDIWSSNWIETLVSKCSSEVNSAAFGCLQFIDSDGKHLFFPEAMRKVNLQGSKIQRRINFFISSYAKANLFYGLFPRLSIKEVDFDTIFSFPVGADVLLVYDILSRLSFVFDKDATFYKRNHDKSDWALTCERTRKKDNHFKLLKKVKRNLSCHHFMSHIKISSNFERVLLSLAFPFLLIRTSYTQFFKLIRKYR